MSGGHYVQGALCPTFGVDIIEYSQCAAGSIVIGRCIPFTQEQLLDFSVDDVTYR